MENGVAFWNKMAEHQPLPRPVTPCRDKLMLHTLFLKLFHNKLAYWNYDLEGDVAQVVEDFMRRFCHVDNYDDLQVFEEYITKEGITLKTLHLVPVWQVENMCGRRAALLFRKEVQRFSLQFELHVLSDQELANLFV